jgi:hypothetical protein
MVISEKWHTSAKVLNSSSGDGVEGHVGFVKYGMVKWLGFWLAKERLMLSKLEVWDIVELKYDFCNN